jgi:uncharacterized glyoxalase superfamily protein PhnB
MRDRPAGGPGHVVTRIHEAGDMAITPYLYYADVERAMVFLGEAFGFRKSGRPLRGANGRIRHAAMKLGDGLVMMGQPPGRYRNPRTLGQATQSLYVIVGNVDRHYRRARAAGAVILEALTATEYGHRRYGAIDPEGHEWYFAQEARAD